MAQVVGDQALAWVRSVAFTSEDQNYRALSGLLAGPESPINKFPKIREALVIRKNYKLLYYLEKKGLLSFKAFEATYETRSEGTTERIYDGQFHVSWKRYRDYIITNLEAEFKKLDLTEFLKWSKAVAEVYLGMYLEKYPCWPKAGTTQPIKFTCAGCLQLEDEKMGASKELAFGFNAAGTEAQQNSMYLIRVPLGIKYILLTYDNSVLGAIENDLEKHEQQALDYYKERALSMTDDLRQFLTG